MNFFLLVVMEGLAIGSIFSIVALGFVLIYKSSKVLNFAQGELLMLGAYLGFTFITLFKLPLVLGVFLTFTLSAAVGILIERFVIDRMIGKSILSLIMATIGLAYLLQSLVLIFWGPQTKPFAAIFPTKPLKIYQAVVPQSSIWVLAISVGFMFLFYFFFKYSRRGIAMRATANDQVAAFGVGINVKWILAIAWGISALVSTFGGIILAQMYGLSTNLNYIGLKVFPVVILGGLDSIPGAIIGGFIIGLLDSFSRGYLGAYFAADLEVVPFVVLILILFVKPYGLFGTARIERL